MKREPFVDQEICIGCGICADNVPDVFHITSDNKAVCFDPLGTTDEEIQLQAIDLCPVNCISWKECEQACS